MFDWMQQGDRLTKKVSIKTLGIVGNNSPSSVAIDTNNFSILVVDKGSNAANVQEAELGGTITITKAGDDSPNAYVLPWQEGKAAKMTLGSAHNYFFTPQLNGCGVLIAGDPVSPTVIHANTQPDILSQGMPSNASARADWEKNYFYRIWSDLYRVLVTKLGALNLLPANNRVLFLPEEYIYAAPGGASSFVSVYGKKASGGWSFYATHAGAASGLTKKIWPA